MQYTMLHSILHRILHGILYRILYRTSARARHFVYDFEFETSINVVVPGDEYFVKLYGEN